MHQILSLCTSVAIVGITGMLFVCLFVCLLASKRSKRDTLSRSSMGNVIRIYIYIYRFRYVRRHFSGAGIM